MLALLSTLPNALASPASRHAQNSTLWTHPPALQEQSKSIQTCSAIPYEAAWPRRGFLIAGRPSSTIEEDKHCKLSSVDWLFVNRRKRRNYTLKPTNRNIKPRSPRSRTRNITKVRKHPKNQQKKGNPPSENVHQASILCFL